MPMKDAIFRMRPPARSLSQSISNMQSIIILATVRSLLKYAVCMLHGGQLSFPQGRTPNGEHYKADEPGSFPQIQIRTPLPGTLIDNFSILSFLAVLVAPANMETVNFTFGVELELVLVPDFGKLQQVTEIEKELQEIQENSSTFFKAILNPDNKNQRVDKNGVNVRKLWAKCIAKLISIVTGKEDFVKWADDADLDVHKADGTYYTWWTVIDDDAISLETEKECMSRPLICLSYVMPIFSLDTGTVEIVSPVNDLSQAWKQVFESVWCVIDNFFTIQKGQRGSTHVHVARGREQPVEANLAYGKAVATFVAYWDPCLYLLAPSWRKKRLQCANNIRHSPLADVLQEFNKQEYEKVFEKITELETSMALDQLMSEGRFFAWNFANLYTNKHNDMMTTGTIEYRRCPMSESLEDIHAHVAISVGFVRAAVTTGHDSELYLGMAADLINFPEYTTEEFEHEDVRLPAEIVAFGEEKFEGFKQFMLVSTKAIGLQDVMPMEPSKV